MNYLKNKWRGTGLPDTSDLADGQIIDCPDTVMALLELCPAYLPTPLVAVDALAKEIGISALHIKDERQRMGLGSFKALGAAFAIAKQASVAADGDLSDPIKVKAILAGRSFVTASAGNHGLSVAAGAAMFGATAIIYLAQTVPASFAALLREYGAKVVVAGANYEESMSAAAKAAKDQGWTLLSDSTWQECMTGQDVMEGYLALAVEVVAQIPTAPSHIFLQAGVGGLAASLTAYFRKIWGQVPQIIVVEPEAAPVLQDCIRAGKLTAASGPASDMGRLDCKEASHLALRSLAQQADGFITLSDAYVIETIEQLSAHGCKTSSSGGAGFAALVGAKENAIAGINSNSRVLVILSERAPDA